MSPVPLAIAVATALDTLVHQANAFVEPTMPRVPMADPMVASATSPVHAHMSSVARGTGFDPLVRDSGYSVLRRVTVGTNSRYV
jgi:alcohol dehydrogenase class IV